MHFNIKKLISKTLWTQNWVFLTRCRILKNSSPLSSSLHPPPLVVYICPNLFVQELCNWRRSQNIRTSHEKSKPQSRRVLNIKSIFLTSKRANKYDAKYWVSIRKCELNRWNIFGLTFLDSRTSPSLQIQVEGMVILGSLGRKTKSWKWEAWGVNAKVGASTGGKHRSNRLETEHSLAFDWFQTLSRNKTHQKRKTHWFQTVR